MSNVAEHAFSIDDFNNPKIFKDKEAIFVLLMRLLLLEPGLFQSHPDMGVGLVSRYRYGVDVASDLESDFSNQIATYLPQLQGVRVTVKQVGQVLNIGVEYEEMIYGISFNQSNSEIVTNSAALSEL